ncbi:MAG: hypothetical protein JRH11_00960 [Deltaproteobacteria bacterium]|nr:hypothetical protein [Deltaproteobacteria bacterium]
MQGELPNGTRVLLVGGPLAGAALLLLVVFLAERGNETPAPSASSSADSTETQSHVDDSAPATSPAAGGTLLAPAGYVARDLDAFESSVLHLGLIDREGAGTLCTIGGGTNAAAPLALARCRTATPAELTRPAPGSVADARPLGDASYQIGPGGELVVTGTSGNHAVTPMPEEPEAIHVCEAGDTRVVAVDGNLVHGVRQTAVAFIDASAGSDAMLVETHVYAYHLACRPDEARLTWLEAAVEGENPILVVEQVVCTREGCETMQNRLPRTGTDPVVACIAGQVLLLSAGEDGTRMRMAPVTAIDDAPDLDVPPDGDFPVLSRALYARGGAAVVVLRTSRGVRALRVDATGVVRPLPVTGSPEPGL